MTDETTPPTPTPSAQSTGVLRGTVVVSILTQLSRILGLIRDMLTVRLLGAGGYADAYFTALKIPNLLRSYLAEGAMTSAFVPVFAHELEKSKEAAQEALERVGALLILVATALTFLGIIYAEDLVRFFAPGFVAEQKEHAAQLTQLMFPFLILVSLTSLISAALNTVKIFGTAALAQVMTNLALIAGAVLAFFVPHHEAAPVLAWSLLFGGVCGVVCQLPRLHKAGFVIRLSKAPTGKVVREVLLLMLPALFGASIYQLNIFASSLLASLLDVGAVSALYCADRLAQLPIGVFTVALSSVLLPTLARAKAQKDSAQFGKSLIDALRYTSFIIAPLAFALWYFALPLTRLIYEGGRFDAADAIKAADALRGYAIGLWSVSCYAVGVRALLAKKDTTTPALLGVFSFIINLLMTIILMGPPQTAVEGSIRSFVVTMQQALGVYLPLGNFSHTGIALASSIASILIFFALIILLHKKESTIHWMNFWQVLSSTLPALALSYLALELSGAALLTPLYSVLFGLPLCGAMYFLASWSFSSREAFELGALVSKLFHKSR